MTLLFDSALKATLILAAAWIAARVLRRASADLRHRVWLTALAAVALLPALPAMPEGTAITISAVASGPAAAARFPWAATLWATGAALVAGRLLIGIGRVLLWARGAQRDGAILYSDRIQTPMTWGTMILLPAAAEQWSEKRRAVALCHERAHLERADWIWQTFAQLMTAIFWFHPLVWLAAAELRKEGENAADDRVLAAGIPAADYAQQLIDVARRMTANFAAAPVAMVRKSPLENRVRAILDSSRRRTTAGVPASAAIVIAAALALASCAIFQGVKVHRVGEPGLTPPSVASKVEPQYTAEARQAKAQGPVVVKLEVDQNGVAQNLQVTKSLGNGLDDKALEAIRQWRFNPGRKNGKPVRVAATIQVNFRLL